MELIDGRLTFLQMEPEVGKSSRKGLISIGVVAPPFELRVRIFRSVFDDSCDQSKRMKPSFCRIVRRHESSEFPTKVVTCQCPLVSEIGILVVIVIDAALFVVGNRVSFF